MDDCIFCKIINHQIPSFVIAENDNVIAFVSRQNDPLVVPKKHIKDIYELDDQTGSEIIKELNKIAKAVKKGLGCDGVYITQANEPAAGRTYSIFIFYPKWNDEAKNEVKLTEDTERQITMEKVKAAYE
jgi:histidine triad (HIT) family protein